MCKVAGVTKVTDENRDNVWLFMMMLGDLMSNFNSDGLGYAAFDKKGNLFGEKWLVNNQSFTDLSKTVPNLTADKMDKLYSYFGNEVKREEAQGIILHTRFATCERGIKNAHPFVNSEENPEIAIIHNGVISNHMDLEKKFSTCDSEVIVHLMDKHQTNKNFNALDQVTNRLFGWYTVLALSKDDKGNMVMDAFTDRPRLSSFFIPELDTRVYSTESSDIIKVCKDLGFSYKDGKTMKSNTAQRIDVLTGEVIDRKVTTEMSMDNYLPRHQKHRQVTWMNGNFSDDSFVDDWFKKFGSNN